MRKRSGVGLIAGFYILSSALNVASVNNVSVSYAKELSSRKASQLNDIVIKEIIKYYGVIDNYDEDFAKYLVKKGVSKSDYKQCVEFIKKNKGTKIQDLYEIENLVYAFDTILYTNSVVRSIYKSNLETFKDKEEAWKNTVKGLIYDTDWLSKTYEDSIKELLDIEKLYKYKFGREMTSKELDYAKDPTKLKYILYSGVLGKDLEQSEIAKIDSGQGYQLLNITSQEYLEYSQCMSKLRKILNVSEEYIKSIKIHKKVRDEILSKYKIDIYTKLSDLDRISCYEKSLVNYNYSEKVAKEVFINILTGRGYIGGEAPSEPSTSITSDAIVNEPEKPLGNGKDNITNNDYLTDKDYEYIEETLEFFKDNMGETIYTIKPDNYTSEYYAKLGEMIDVYKESADKKILMIMVGDIKIYTVIEIDGDSINQDDLNTVMNQIVMELSGKLVESKEEMLLFVNGKIGTLEKKSGDYTIAEINKSLEIADVKLKIVALEDAIMEYSKEISKNVLEEVRNEYE